MLSEGSALWGIHMHMYNIVFSQLVMTSRVPDLE